MADPDELEQLRRDIAANGERIDLIETSLIKALEESIADLTEIIDELKDDDEADDWKRGGAET